MSTDQYKCRVKGCLPNTRGKEDPQKMYRGGTVFVDHASGVIKINHHVSLGASDTVRSKELHELWTPATQSSRLTSGRQWPPGHQRSLTSKRCPLKPRASSRTSKASGRKKYGCRTDTTLSMVWTTQLRTWPGQTTASSTHVRSHYKTRSSKALSVSMLWS